MPSRMASGKTTNKFDKETHHETLDKMMTITTKLNKVVTEIDDPIKVDIEKLQNRCDTLETENSAIRTQLAEMTAKYDALRTQVRAFLTSRFFRFLNFFGRWLIYAPDGSIYANTPENRHLVEAMRSTPNIDGSRTEESKYRLVDKLEIVNLLNGVGERIVLYRFHGTLREAIDVLRVRGITPHAGDMLNTLQDQKDYIWVESDNGVNITELGDLPLAERFPK